MSNSSARLNHQVESEDVCVRVRAHVRKIWPYSSVLFQTSEKSKIPRVYIQVDSQQEEQCIPYVELEQVVTDVNGTEILRFI